MQHSPLDSAHRALQARMIDFHGWSMPLHYGSQLAEHHAVRQKAGLFDVSHMRVWELQGAAAGSFLGTLLANNPARMREPGRAIYSTMLNEEGGVIDDLIVYRMADSYWMVTNCGTFERVQGWLQGRSAGLDVALTQRSDLAILALQGPSFLQCLEGACGSDLVARVSELRPFSGLREGELWIARTGYTGEDGVEMILPGADAPALWESLLAAGAAPAGLGARDTLRLEAGLCLYGSDMDETLTPLEANLGWTVAWKPEDRDFTGRAALVRQKAAGEHPVLTGARLQEPGVIRGGYLLYGPGAEQPCGKVTSGAFSPTLQASIALCRVQGQKPDEVFVEIRGKRRKAQWVQPPFLPRR